MKVIGYILGACLVLAIVRAMLVALVAVLLVAIVIGVFTKPRETFGLLIFFFGIGLVEAHPLVCLAVLTASILLAWISSRRV